METGKSVQKNFRLSPGSVELLEAAAAATGTTDTRIIELAIACYAMEIAVEVKRARQFLFDNLASRIATSRIHARKTPVKERAYSRP